MFFANDQVLQQLVSYGLITFIVTWLPLVIFLMSSIASFFLTKLNKHYSYLISISFHCNCVMHCIPSYFLRYLKVFSRCFFVYDNWNMFMSKVFYYTNNGLCNCWKSRSWANMCCYLSNEIVRIYNGFINNLKTWEKDFVYWKISLSITRLTI